MRNVLLALYSLPISDYRYWKTLKGLLIYADNGLDLLPVKSIFPVGKPGVPGVDHIWGGS